MRSGGGIGSLVRDILGFDNDDSTVFDAAEFLRDARITHAMIGMLTAIPKTRCMPGWRVREARPDDVASLERT